MPFVTGKEKSKAKQKKETVSTKPKAIQNIERKKEYNMTEDTNPALELIDALINDELQNHIMHLIIEKKDSEEIIETLLKEMTGRESI